MKKISVDFSAGTGKIKPMHAINNGPVYGFADDQRVTNIDAFREAGFPYARTHDAAFFSTYGGEHTVDITAIFPNFDADPYREESYDFACTDQYLKEIDLAGVKVFYRLGQKIEHYIKKFGTVPPKDFHKWAVICEHIIRHYNYGWANGLHMNIEYWEIWNEPDLDQDDSPNKRTWGGTKKQFFELYHITATHLKKCFPELKIGGPALAGNKKWAEEFIEQLDAPLDFFSFHIYAPCPENVFDEVIWARKLLDGNGYQNTETVLNEWNYVKGWYGDTWIYSLKTEKGLKGSSFTAATMCLCQESPLDILMYYDARPCAMNGLFNTDFVYEKLKGYYPFLMFNELYKLGGGVKAVTDADDLYALAAKNETDGAVMMTYFNDDDNAPQQTVEVALNGLSGTSEVEFYILDSEHDLSLFRKETFHSSECSSVITMPLHSSVLIKVKRT